MQSSVFRNSDESWRCKLCIFLSYLPCWWSWGVIHINMDIIRYLKTAKRVCLLQKSMKNNKGGFFIYIIQFGILNWILHCLKPVSHYSLGAELELTSAGVCVCVCLSENIPNSDIPQGALTQITDTTYFIY